MPEYAEWKTMRLADTGKWLSGGTPSTANPRYWNGSIPWISASSLKDFDIDDSERRVTHLGSTHATTRVADNTILFVVRGMSLKTEFRIGVTAKPMTFGQDCKAIIPTSDIYPRFLAYALKAESSTILSMVDEAGNGTGRLPTDQLARLRIGIPHLREQRRIAEILDTVDESIRSTERLAAKRMTLLEAITQDQL